jgi:CHAD domain-containing protein
VAKATDIEALRGEMAFGEAAALVVEVRARELFELSAGVLDTDDIERVHDMRVATRRLRAVLEIFGECFPRKAHRQILRDVKGLADALGERRDPDVQIEALAEHVAALDAPDRPAAERLVAQLRATQLAGNETLAAMLHAVEVSDLRGRVAALVEGAR